MERVVQTTVSQSVGPSSDELAVSHVQVSDGQQEGELQVGPSQHHHTTTLQALTGLFLEEIYHCSPLLLAQV